MVLLRIKTLVGHVMCLKRAITASFERSEPFHFVKANGRVGAIPTYRVYRLYDSYVYMQLCVIFEISYYKFSSSITSHLLSMSVQVSWRRGR